jgi:2-dehydro-3-deoxyphosphogluconate aldolase/(4S)-4-hydroxy-2-oxoglutarate aldolase
MVACTNELASVEGNVSLAHTPRQALPDPIARPGVIAILRGLSPNDVVDVASTLLTSGIEAVEVTMNSPEAIESIHALASAHHSSLLIGAGTVRRDEDARLATEAGARFIVTPATTETVIEWCVHHEVPCIAGALTPTEVDLADRLAATAVKIFPIMRLGAEYLRDLHGPFDHVPLVPVGGVDDGNAEAMFRSGAAAVGVGSWLTAGRDAPTIAARAESLLRAIAAGRTG